MNITLESILGNTGFAALHWQMVLMWIVVVVLLYLGIVKKYEPLLLIPISLGAMLANLPIRDVILSEPVYDSGHVLEIAGGLFYYIQQGVKLELFPPIIFLGVGALTDFGPLIANPRTLLLGAAAQFGIFATFLGAVVSGFFTINEAAAIAIIGGADYVVIERPIYKADGRKLPDCYAEPYERRDELQRKLGRFPLFNFWGPTSNLTSSRWIAASNAAPGPRENR